MSDSNGPQNPSFPTSLGHDEDKIRQWMQSNAIQDVTSLCQLLVTHLQWENFRKQERSFNRLVDTVGERKGWDKLRLALTYIHYHVWNSHLVGTCYTTQAAQPGTLWWPRGVRWGRWKEGSRGREYSIVMTDLCWSMAETNTPLYGNYPPIKNKHIN